MPPHTSQATASYEPAPVGPAPPPEPAALTPQDLVPHLHDLARSLREQAAKRRSP